MEASESGAGGTGADGPEADNGTPVARGGSSLSARIPPLPASMLPASDLSVADVVGAACAACAAGGACCACRGVCEEDAVEGEGSWARRRLRTWRVKLVIASHVSCAG